MRQSSKEQVVNVKTLLTNHAEAHLKIFFSLCNSFNRSAHSAGNTEECFAKPLSSAGVPRAVGAQAPLLAGPVDTKGLQWEKGAHLTFYFFTRPGEVRGGGANQKLQY